MEVTTAWLSALEDARPHVKVFVRAAYQHVVQNVQADVLDAIPNALPDVPDVRTRVKTNAIILARMDAWDALVVALVQVTVLELALVDVPLDAPVVAEVRVKADVHKAVQGVILSVLTVQVNV